MDKIISSKNNENELLEFKQLVLILEIFVKNAVKQPNLQKRNIKLLGCFFSRIKIICCKNEAKKKFANSY